MLELKMNPGDGFAITHKGERLVISMTKFSGSTLSLYFEGTREFEVDRLGAVIPDTRAKCKRLWEEASTIHKCLHMSSLKDPAIKKSRRSSTCGLEVAPIKVSNRWDNVSCKQCLELRP